MVAGAEAQFGGGEEAVHDHVVPAHAVVHQLGGIALGTDDEERRDLALADAARELDEDLAAVVESAKRPPRSPSVPTRPKTRRSRGAPTAQGRRVEAWISRHHQL